MATKSRIRSCLAAAIAALLYIPLFGSAAERTPPSGDAIQVSAKKDGQTITVDAAFTVKAAQRQAWDVLTDFDHMPNFLPGLESSKVIRRSGNVLQVEQKGKESYGPFSFSFDNLREVRLSPYGEIKSHLIKGSMKRSDGVTRLTGKQGETRVTYHGVFVPDVNVPAALGIPAIESATRKQFEELRGEMLKRSKRR